MDFQTRFATEDDCRDYLFDCRWPDGFICPGCRGRSAGQAPRRNLRICTRLQVANFDDRRHRDARDAYAAVYLDEFVFRHNRRRTRWPSS